MNLYAIVFEKYSEEGEYLGKGSVRAEAQHCSQAALMVESATTPVIDVQRLQTDVPTKKLFDEVVYATGCVQYAEHSKTIKLDGEFTFEATEMIIYAMNNHPEWFKLNDQA